MSQQGLYRKRDGWGDQHSVRVKYDNAVELEVPESFYREEGWQPPIEELPWHGEGATVPGPEDKPAGGAGDRQHAADDGSQPTKS